MKAEELLSRLSVEDVRQLWVLFSPFSLDEKYGVAMSDEISVVNNRPKQSTNFVGS